MIMFKINEKILLQSNEIEIGCNLLSNNKFYKHSNILNDLINENKENNLRSNETIQLCIYNVNTNGKYPFIQFLLKKNDNRYYFHQLKIEPNELCIENIECYLKKIFSDNITYEFRCIINYKNEKYVLIEMHINRKKKNDNDLHEILLLDEIINLKRKYNIDVNSNVIDFFTEYLRVFLLYDEENKELEIPSVLYCSREKHGIQNTSTTSLLSCKGDAFSILGPYYYFTNFENAYNVGERQIYRVAVFVGKQLVKLNNPEDTIDNSRIKLEKIDQNEMIRKKEILTMRITDYDGNWINMYDSVFIGKIELDDGSKLSQTPIYAIKELSQVLLL